MNANLIAPEVIQRFAGSLLHFIWQGAAIAIIAAAGLRLLRHRSTESRYAFAIGALTVFAVVGNSWLRRTARRIKLEV